jgi:adenylate kinase
MEVENLARTIVFLLGCPGAGKGTQAPVIRNLLGIPQISTGGILRDEIVADSELGRAVQNQMKAGKLVSDAVVNQLVAQRILKGDCASGFILDGYPRTVEQAEWFQVKIAEADEVMAIDIDVDVESLVSRLKTRLQCKCCNAVYNVATAAPRIEGLCDHCGIGLVQRDDDREDIIRERFHTYQNHTRPLVEYFRRFGVYHRIDGMRSAGEVSQSISFILQSCSPAAFKQRKSSHWLPVLSF